MNHDWTAILAAVLGSGLTGAAALVTARAQKRKGKQEMKSMDKNDVISMIKEYSDKHEARAERQEAEIAGLKGDVLKLSRHILVLEQNIRQNDPGAEIPPWPELSIYTHAVPGAAGV